MSWIVAQRGRAAAQTAEGASPVEAVRPRQVAGSSPAPGLDSTPDKHCKTCRCFKPKPKRSGLKRDSKDAAWSKMVRERAGMRCQFVAVTHLLTSNPPVPARSAEGRCHAAIGRGLAPQGLHAAHCFGRGNPRTRLDPDNGLAMCWPHHREIDGDKSLRFAIFRWWLGDERFDALQAKANAKRDRATKGPNEVASR